MAKPIKNTPVLRGKEALSFYDIIKSNRNKTVSQDSLNAILSDAKSLKQLLKAN